MKGLSCLLWNLGIGREGGLGVSERTSLTVSSSRWEWLGGGDLLTPLRLAAAAVVELEMRPDLLGLADLLVLTQQPIGVFGCLGMNVGGFHMEGAVVERRRGGGGGNE